MNTTSAVTTPTPGENSCAPRRYASHTVAPKPSSTSQRISWSPLSPKGNASELTAVDSGCGVGEYGAVKSGVMPCQTSCAQTSAKRASKLRYQPS